MEIKKGQVYIANLNPRIGTESGRVRPVILIQDDRQNPPAEHEEAYGEHRILLA